MPANRGFMLICIWRLCFMVNRFRKWLPLLARPVCCLLVLITSVYVEAVWPRGWGGGFVIWSSRLKPCTLLLTGFVLSSPLPPPVAAIVYSQLVCHKSVGIFKRYVY